MTSISLGTIESYLFSNGSKSVDESLALLESLSFCIQEKDKQKFDNYLSAARRFSKLCSNFLDIVSRNKNFVIYSLLTNFVEKYPKTKQNLADPKELTNSVINYYLMKRKTSKLYKPEKDLILKFIRDNTTDIYNCIVVITNVMRAKSLLKLAWMPK
jgi:hypothetical protein